MAGVKPSRLKQRLIGVFVIISMAVIFLPQILLEEMPQQLQSGGDRNQSMPESPYGLSEQAFEKTMPEQTQTLIIPLPPLEAEKFSDSVMAQREIVEQSTLDAESIAEVNASGNAAAEKEMQAVEAMAIQDSKKTSLEGKEIKKPEKERGRGWAIQVGSFNSEKNALSLRNQLRKQGYSTFVEKTRGVTGVNWRVRVGPELNRERAEKMKQRLLNQAKVDGIVTLYP